MSEEFSSFRINLARSEQPMLHMHDFHEIFYSFGNSGVQVTEKGVIKNRKGDLFFFPAGVRHIGNGDERGIAHCGVLYLGKQSFPPYIPGEDIVSTVIKILCARKESGDFRVPLRNESGPELMRLMNDFFCEKGLRQPGGTLYLRMMFLKLFLFILRNSNWTKKEASLLTSNSGDERIDRACVFIKANFMRPLTVQQMAEVTGLSRSHFHSLFLRITGQTMTQYVNAIRYDEAVEKLKSTDMSLADIALSCGFTSLSNFYRVFREVDGRCPKDLRMSR